MLNPGECKISPDLLQIFRDKFSNKQKDKFMLTINYMPNKTASIIIAVLAIAIIVIVIIAVLRAQAYKNAVSLPSKLGFVLGVCTHGNESSEIYALSNGVKYFRTDITQSKSQNELLDYEHSRYNAQYLGILDYESLPNGSSNRQWNLSEWNQSIENILTMYPWINTWEIWNEPYVQNFQTGYMNGSAYNYYMVIKSAAIIIKHKEPNATIVCFGGAPLGIYSIYEWYAHVWGYGAANYCNAISVHAYTNGPEPIDSGINTTWNASLEAYEYLTNKPIWVTEFGMPSSSAVPGYSTGLQNEFLGQSLSFFNRYEYVKRVYWYDLWGLSDGLLKDNFGLLNLSNPSNGTQSSAWQEFIKAYSASKN